MTSQVASELKNYLSPDIFAKAFAIEGEIFRNVANRQTLRFHYQNKNYFIKRHHGVGWLEIIKNILQGKKPILGAYNEWQALEKLQQANIAAPKVMAYGQRGNNPAYQQSFIITEALNDSVSLEDFCKPWAYHTVPFAEKQSLLNQVSIMTRRMHQQGIAHRDLYICHFLLDKAQLAQGRYQLYLIDLHRALIHHTLPKRWLIKDLAGLYFSAMNIGLTKRDIFRFLKNYFQQDLSVIFQQQQKLLRLIEKKAIALFLKASRKIPAAIGYHAIDKNFYLADEYQNSSLATLLKENFHQLSTFGEKITKDPQSHVNKFRVADDDFYLKYYFRAGKKLRKYIGRSRVRAEWENLFYFDKLGIPTAQVVLYGEQRDGRQFDNGIVMTRGLTNTTDLAQLVRLQPQIFRQKIWLKHIISELALYTRLMHQQGFIHNDLKWRNILVNPEKLGQIYFIDCPTGRIRYGIFRYYGKTKDIACLEKVARFHLSKTMRLRFYLLYAGKTHLASKDKAFIKRIYRYIEKDDKR